MSLPMARAGTGWALRTLGTQTSLGSWGILWNGYLKGCKLEDLEMCSGTNRTCTVAMAAAVAAETEGLGMCQVSSAPELWPCSRTCQHLHPQVPEMCRDSWRERHRNLNSNRRRTAHCSVNIWSSQFPFKMQFSALEIFFPTGIEVHQGLCAPSLWKALPVPIQLCASTAQGTLCHKQQGKAVFGIIWKLMLRLMIHN